MTGRKNGAYTENLQPLKMKAFCKQKNITINDYVTSVLSTTLFEYFNTHQVVDGEVYQIPASVDMGMPISLRTPFKRIEDVRMVNDFCAMPISIPICRTLNEALVPIARNFKRLRNSLDVYGVFEVFRISVNLPFTLPRANLDFLSSKYTAIFTNVNASKKAYVVNGKKQLGVFFFVPGVGMINTGFSILTTGPFMSFACLADEHSIRDPEVLVAIFERKNQENLQSVKDKDLSSVI